MKKLITLVLVSGMMLVSGLVIAGDNRSGQHTNPDAIAAPVSGTDYAPAGKAINAEEKIQAMKNATTKK